MKSKLSPPIAFMVLLILGTIWGSTILLAKHIVSTGHGALGLTFWQMTIGAVMLTVVGWIRRSPLPISSKDIKFYIILALIGTLIPNSISYTVAAHLPAGLMALTLATVPMFALLIALGLGSEKPQLGRIFGICLGGIAMLLVLGPKTSLPSASMAIWVLVALLAPLCYGIEGNYLVRSTPTHMNTLNALRGASIVGALIAGPLALATDNWVSLNTHWTSVEWGILLNSLLHVITYGAYIWLVGRTGAVFASQVAYIVTLSGVFLGMMVFSEQHSTLVWLALTLMMVGLAMVQPKEVKPEAK